MPMKGHKEISRFTANGKTFFFNEMKAKNDDTYLSINALFGDSRHERITLFDSHLIQFYMHFVEAMEKLSGFGPAEKKDLKDPNRLPPWQSECPKCDSDDFTVDINAPEWREWAIVCQNCDSPVLSTEEYDENG